MGYYTGDEKELAGYAQGSKYAGVPTASGQLVGGGVGVGLGLLTGPAAPIVSPILGGIFGAIGGAFGATMETPPEPVYQPAFEEPEKPFIPNPMMESLAAGSLQDPSWTEQQPSLVEQYNVQNPFGFA
jgi:hypothetical protein